MRCLVLLLSLTVLTGRIRAESPVTVEVATDRDYYLTDARHQVYAEIRLGAAVLPDRTSSSFSNSSVTPASVGRRNVAFVLDRSGSMAGERMRALREGITGALALLGEQDVVSVVLFSSEVETIVEARPRRELANLDTLLAQVEPVGGSALYDALNQGAAQLRRFAGPSTSNQLILVTDGPPTKGPREMADFTRLASALAEEHITISAVGIGDEFNEDMLAALARAGNGRFRYVAQPATLPEVLQDELALPGALRARDVTLTAEILSDCGKIESYGWVPGAIKDQTVTYRVPSLFAGQKITLLLGAEMSPRHGRYRFMRLRTTWTGVPDGQPHQMESVVEVRLDSEPNAVAKSANPAVVRTAVDTLISEGLQKAIERVDQGDFRRALRELRDARSDAKSLNFAVEDPQAEASIRRLEAYITGVQVRGLNQLDRKVLRSGLFNQFSIPVAEDPPDR